MILIAVLWLSTAGQLSSLPPSGSAVQDAEEAQRADEREDVAEQIKALDAHVKKKGKEDLEAIALIDALTRDFEEFGPKDRAAIVKALDRALKVKRTGELDDGVPDDRLFYASAMALSKMAPESVKPLMSWLDSRTHKSNIRLRVRLAKSLGSTGDPKGIKSLLRLLTDKEVDLQAAGAEALGYFDGEDLDTRKELFKELLDVLVAQKAKKDADTTDVEAFERWSRMAGPFIASMQALSGHDERDPEAWQRWWNKNKKADWDA